jgi:hypothetical protein
MKVAVCIPRYGDTKGAFAICLARLVAHSLARSPEPLEMEIFSISSSDLPHSRTELLKDAIQWQARYLLWLDADQTFPPDALLRLLAHRLDVVGCNYARRSDPTGPVAAKLDDRGGWQHIWTTEALAKAGTIEEAAHVGLGLCLMDMTLLHRVKAHVEKGVGWANWAPFDRKLQPGSTARMGEDASFFQELREAGVVLHLDHALSWEVGHIHERVITNADAEAQKDAWLNRHR